MTISMTRSSGARVVLAKFLTASFIASTLPASVPSASSARAPLTVTSWPPSSKEPLPMPAARIESVTRTMFLPSFAW